MDSCLAERIKQVYTTGLLQEPDESAFGANDQDARIDQVLEQVEAAVSLRVHREQWEGQPSYQFALTSKHDPLFREWYQVMNGPTKLQWLASNRRPFTILWLQISRVTDLCHFYFNEWHPRGDTGNLDIDCREEAVGDWLNHQAGLIEILRQHGFSGAKESLLSERVPFLLEHDHDGTPDNDPRWDDEDWDPPLVPTTLQMCLFGP